MDRCLADLMAFSGEMTGFVDEGRAVNLFILTDTAWAIIRYYEQG